ncbi:MAG: 4-hydroxy-3-methylbut-2-enyl diphosphate reductase, partial [Bacilli bacterium]
MKVIKITPRGYCHGVVSALQDVAIAMQNKKLKRPIYILGEIVHNHIITDAFSSHGVITLNGKTREELLDEIETGTVIITAHGASYKVIAKAIDKGLDVIDATCVDVYKTHDLIKEKTKAGYDVLYIGKKNHPEPEGSIAINPEKIHLISSIEDLENLHIDNNKIIITNQTTMSMWDTIKIIEKSKLLFPNIEIHNEICMATQQRQEAVYENADNIDLLIVVGDVNSNNTNRLAQIAQE